MIPAYHFHTGKLRDGRALPPLGEWLEHTGPVQICESGLHASERILDALSYAPGLYLDGVTVDEIQERQDDKLVCRRRRRDWTLDAEPLLRAFARWCAVQALPYWSAPQVARDYLRTGDPAIRAAARDAAGAARAAAGAAWAAAGAAGAAGAAAWDAAGAARDAAGAARAAAGAAGAAGAAWDAAWDAQEMQLRAMVTEARAGRTEWVWEVQP